MFALSERSLVYYYDTQGTVGLWLSALSERKTWSGLLLSEYATQGTVGLELSALSEKKA